MFQGRLLSIHVTPGKAEPMQQVAEAKIVVGRGLEGDRYFLGVGTFSKSPGTGRAVTLIEMETIEALRAKNILLEAGEARRNLVTQGVPLNHLVGHTFQVGEVRLCGIRLCEPCSHLEGLTREGVLRELLHRGGLRADIVTGGIIRAADAITGYDP
jgi:MOSC domain-containing protein YiiM